MDPLHTVSTRRRVVLQRGTALCGVGTTTDEPSIHSQHKKKSTRGSTAGDCSLWCPWKWDCWPTFKDCGHWDSTRQRTDLQGKMYHRQVSRQARYRETQTTAASTDENRLSFSGLEPVTIASTSTCAGSSDWPCQQPAAAELASKEWSMSSSDAPYFMTIR